MNNTSIARGNPARDSQNRMKLGVFALNIDGGCTLTNAPERHRATDWDRSLRVAMLADRAGYEVLLPVGRWRGYGGESNPMGISFETYTWAAGMAAVTSQIGIFATSHLPTVNPVFAAKQSVTIDYISGGRFGLNILCGWYEAEMRMFNNTMMEHDLRYDYADEWLAIVQKAWTSKSTFDFTGKFFTVKDVFSEPKPLDKPFLMNAGGSPRGRKFCTQHCDAAFLILKYMDGDGAVKAQIESYRALADLEGRSLQIWVYAYVVLAESREKAERFVSYYADGLGNDVACDNVTAEIGIQSGMFASTDDAMRFRHHFKAGFAGIPLVGTAEDIAAEIERYHSLGVDGICLTWLDYLTGIELFNEKVLPLLEERGLRRPHGLEGVMHL
ncbi:LLM class flavin-dependent oxidoreductase [Gluconacetobacter azotocaptans]|uniref:LLM class flavin-dependent oxidoreductase n=1 Tax=Gluconacetobacter azotocaptans TaxID=142834 RepID=UPI00195825D1|nr:LLM class flavin-dependent oxidoreductase [Gluconacetobacter azotocaptans]MBM9400786.1 LLM class flavin-dependent oxidoreductase [Gluconacetobacter azotocaptans]